MVDSLVFSLKVNCSDASSERIIDLEYWNLVLLGCGNYIILPTVVPSLASILTLFSVLVSIVIWLGGAKLSVKFVLSPKQNLLAELTSIEVRGFFHLKVTTYFNKQYMVSGFLTY